MSAPLRIAELPPVFRRFWLATGISSLANGIHRSAVPLLASLSTRDPVIVGAIVACSRLPWLVMTLQVGKWIDAHSPNAVVRLGAVVRTASVATLACFLGWRLDDSGMLCLLVFAIATGEVMGDTSSQAWVAHSVKPGLYPTANARIYGTQVLLGQLSGPAIAGYLVSRSPSLSSTASALLQLVAGLLLWQMTSAWRAPPPRPARVGTERADEPPLRRSASALAVILAQPALTGLVLLGMVSMFIYGAWLTAIVIFAMAPQGLSLSPVSYGLLMMTMAAGSLLGSVLATELLRRTSGFWCVVASCVGISGLALGPALSTSTIWVGVSMFVYGLLLSTWNVSAVSFRQSAVPIELAGRVNALYRLGSWGAMPIGAAIAGVVCSKAGTGAVFWGCVGMSALQYPALILIRAMKKYRG